MKTIPVVLASLLLVLGGCGPHENSGAAAGGTQKGSMETPKGAATGQASEGSTDERSAPRRPSSK